MMTKTTHLAPDDIFSVPVPDLDALEHIGRRHQENLDGLRKHEAYLTSEIAHHEAELVTANDALAALPKEHAAGPVFEAKTAIIAIEFNRDVLLEQLFNLQPELAATPALIEANKKAIAAAKADLP
jgi:hypothetical protein